MKVFVLIEDDADYLRVFSSKEKATEHLMFLWEGMKETYPLSHKLYQPTTFYTILEKELE